MTKVYVVGYGGAYAAMFEKAGFELVESIFYADLVCFTGGEDVTPQIYGEKNTASHNNISRDITEAGFFAIAQRLEIPMVGICRGGQFLNVMCGGKMVQHVEGHALYNGHKLEMSGEHFLVSSTHHQLMVEGERGNVIGWAHITDGRDYDPEIIHYAAQRVLCFQPHPEMDGFPECTKLFFDLIEELLL